MQIRTMKLMLAVLGAMSMVLTGCPDGGRESLACTDTTECIEGEICHPTAKVCVQTCTASADCPESSKACEAISATNAQKICQCSTKELCQRDERVSDASNLECTAAKVCAPAGTTPACTKNEDCTGGQTCDVTSGTCKAPTTCQGTGQSTCAYGQFCSASSGSTSSTCAAVPAPTCSNFDNKPAKNFNPATGTGNIIYNVEKLIFGGNSGCADAASQTVKARVSFYSKTDPLPTTKEGLNGFFYVRTTGAELNAVPLANEYQRSTDGKSATISINLCTDASFNQVVLGFYFTNGNGYCATFTK